MSGEPVAYADLHGTLDEAKWRSIVRRVLEHHKIVDGVVTADLVSAILAAAPAPTVSGEPLPLDRDTLGRMVREAWVRWAKTQPNPKASWLQPYDALSEPDKEVDRQIGEAIAKWTMIHADAARALAAAPAPTVSGEEPIYRFLCVGEIVETGDENPTDDCASWEPVMRVAVGYPVARIYKTIRRRVFPAPTRAEVLEEAVRAQPPTRVDRIATPYDRGYFNAVQDYVDAIRALAGEKP